MRLRAEMIYTDSRGWMYQVRIGNSGNRWKTFYLKNTKTGWHAYWRFRWRDSYGEAKADLDAYAKEHGWKTDPGDF